MHVKAARHKKIREDKLRDRHLIMSAEGMVGRMEGWLMGTGVFGE